MKHLCKLLDWSGEDILDVLDLADRLKCEQKEGVAHERLKGKTLAMLFQKASTRTRVSFETGIYQLGGLGLVMNGADTQLGRGEPIRDTARVLSRYVNGIMIRTFRQQDVEELARYASVPVINALTDDYHPCQVLADLMTIREHRGQLEGLKLCYIGDGNNMANSLIVGGLKVGMQIAVATPRAYRPKQEVQDFAAGFGGRFLLTEDRFEAAKGADIVVTDVWASMGQEDEAARRREDFAGWQVNAELMACACQGAMVQHCLPAHRGEEICGEVFEAHAEEIFDEAENRLHVQKAVMVRLMEGR